MKRFLSKITFALILMIILTTSLFVITSFADSYELGNVEWLYEFNEDGETVTITGVTIKANKIDGFKIPENVSIKLEDNSVKFYPVTAIANNAFSSSAERIYGKLTIPETVTSIGDNAFANTHISGEVLIPNSVTSIGAGAFSGLKERVTSLSISSSIVIIPEKAFYQSNINGTIVIPDSVTSIGKNAFTSTNISGELVIPHSVTSVGESAFEKCAKITSLILYSEPADYNYENINKSQEISNSAFMDCTSLSSLTLGTGITSLGNNAFANNTSITEINLNSIDIKDLTATSNTFKAIGTKADGISFKVGTKVTKIPSYLFYSEQIENAPRITSITFEEGSICASIGANSFTNSYFISSVKLPDSIAKIGTNAFKNCYSLTSVTVGTGLTTIEADAFKDCYKLVEVYNTSALNIVSKPGATDNGCLGAYAIDIYTSLGATSKLITTADGFTLYNGDICYLLAYTGSASTVVFPETCNGNPYDIYEYAFYKFPSKINIVLSKYTTAISKYAFKGANINGTLSIPNSVKEIGEEAFADCVGKITKLTLPKNLKEIKEKTFYNSYLIANFTFPSKLQSIGKEAFAKTLIHGEFVIPEGVVNIGESAFNGCYGILGMKLPSTLKDLKASTFNDCLALVSINLENVNAIGSSCFNNCQALKTVNFSKECVYIESKAFAGCQSLYGTIDLSSVTSLSSDAFQNCKRIDAFVLPNIDVSFFNLISGCSSLSAIYTSYNNTKYFAIDGVLFQIDEQLECEAFDSSKAYEKYILINNIVYASADGILYRTTLKATDAAISHTYKTTDSSEFILIGNTPYMLSDNVLYRISQSTVVFYPYLKEGKTYNIPSFVTTIGDKAFHKVSNLDKIIIGDSVKEILANAFNSSSLKTAFIPDTITTLNSGTFSGCKYLQWIVLGQNVETVADNCFENTTATVYSRNAYLTKPSKVTSFITSKAICSNHLYGFVDDDPTCEKSGYSKCTFCDKIEYKKILDHSGPIIETSELSCETDAYDLVECTICNKTVKTNFIPHEGHLSNYTTIEPTSTKPGYTYATCTVCYKTYLSAYIPHKATTSCSSHSTDTIVISPEYSCKTNSLEIIYCKTCGAKVDVTTQIEKTACSFEFEIRIESTCSVNGQIKEKCSICDNIRITELPLAPHDHSWYTVADNKGYEYSTCSVCNTFETREVDYSVFDMLLEQVSEYYETYYAPDTVALLSPIWENRDLNLTQDAVDYNVELLRNILTNVKYNVTDLPVVFIEYEGEFHPDDVKKELEEQEKRKDPTYQIHKRIPKEYGDTKIYIAYIDENGERQTEAVDYNAEIKGRGNSTYSSTKCPYNIKFSNKVDLFGMGAGKKYCLMANLYDQTLMRNAIVIDFAKSIGLEYTPSYQMVEVYVNGLYNGVYMLTTPTDVDENRIEIDEVEDFLLEVENKNAAGDGEVYITFKDKLPNSYLNLLVDSPEDMGAESYSALISAFNQINIAIFSEDWDLIQQWVDVESMAKYYLVHEYLKEVDMCYDSTRLFIKDGKLHGGPVWDFDFGLGNVASGGGNNGSHTAYNNGNDNYVSTNGGAELGVIKGMYDGSGKLLNGDWASTTGYWARGLWENGNANGFFDELYRFSDEFIDLVSQYVSDYSVQMQLLYKNYYSEEDAKTYTNAIDNIHKDQDFTAARIRNWTEYHITSTYSGTTNREISYEKAIAYLREWLQRRHEWITYAYLEVDARPNN